MRAPLADEIGVSTSLFPNEEGALVSAVEAAMAAGVPSITVDGFVAARDAERAARLWREAGGRTMAVSVRLEATGDPTSSDPSIAARGERRLGRAVELARLFRCPRIVVSGLTIDDPGGIWGAEMGARLKGTDETAWTQWRAELLDVRRGVREERVQRLCRRLHALVRRQEGLALAVAPDADPRALLGPEEIGWTLTDVPGLGFWHHTGAAAGLDWLGVTPAASWLSELSGHLCGVYLSDHQRLECELLPGSGTLCLSEWEAFRSPSLARIIRARGPVPPWALRQALAEVRDRLL